MLNLSMQIIFSVVSDMFSMAHKEDGWHLPQRWTCEVAYSATNVSLRYENLIVDSGRGKIEFAAAGLLQGDCTEQRLSTVIRTLPLGGS